MINAKKSLSAAAATSALLVASLAVGGQLRVEGAAQQGSAQQTATPAGDAARGKTLFESSGCFDCHRIGDRGSRFGPDLSDIGERRTPDRLRLALVEPDKEVVPENRFAHVVTRDGTKILGRLLNQDSTSVQLMTQKEELKSYLRANLREYTILDTGLMPSSKGKLTDRQVDDIVGYLSSLKGS
jgi:putative heme-binding domain-containing protein